MACSSKGKCGCDACSVQDVGKSDWPAFTIPALGHSMQAHGRSPWAGYELPRSPITAAFAAPSLKGACGQSCPGEGCDSCMIRGIGSSQWPGFSLPELGPNLRALGRSEKGGPFGANAQRGGHFFASWALQGRPRRRTHPHGKRVPVSGSPQSAGSSIDEPLDTDRLDDFVPEQPNDVPPWWTTLWQRYTPEVDAIPMGHGPWLYHEAEDGPRFDPPDNPACPEPVCLGDLDCEATPPYIHADSSAAPCSLSNLMTAQVDSTCSSAMANFYQVAWCLLRENRDIVEWIFKFNFGTTACVVNVLTNRTPLTLGCETGCSNIAHSYEFPIPDIENFGIPGWGRITTCMDSASNQARLNAFLSGTFDDQVCATIDLAAVLLHETTHICILNYDQDNDPCEASDNVEDTFRWAMSQRYPHSCNSRCCRNWCGANLEAAYMSGIGMSAPATNCP